MAEGARADVMIAIGRPDIAHEIARAQRAAQGYARGYREAAAQAMEAQADDAADIAWTAWKSQQWRVELAATTEASEAFATSREIAFQETVGRHPELALDLWKVWDATLDKRTCPVCAEAHGTIVRAYESFPHGVPGRVHPRCRCTEQLLRGDELWMVN